MRTSQISLFFLAASAAAPVFAAPLPYVIIFAAVVIDPADLPILNSYLKARSNGASDVLSARGAHDGCADSKSNNNFTALPQTELDDATIVARNSMEEFMKVVAKMNKREPDVVERDVTRDEAHESLEARATTEDLLRAMFEDRSLSSREEIQARGLFDSLLEVGMNVVDDLLKRDVGPDISARDSNSNNWNDLMEILNTRELGFKRDLQARATSLLTSVLAWVVHKLMSLPIRFRELTPDELAGRGFIEDIVKAPVPHSREPNPDEEVQARDTTNARSENAARADDATNAFIKALLSGRDYSSDDELAGRSWLDDIMDIVVPPDYWAALKRSTTEDDIEIMAREDGASGDSATNAFIKALMSTRDEEVTRDNVMRLASLASRALDELD